MSQQTMIEKADKLEKEFEGYMTWVRSFIERPTRQKKARVKEKSVMFSNTRAKLNAEIHSTMCDWDDTRTSKEKI